jgi:hypothetical protein
MVPADFLRSVGFKTVRPHPRWPRLRMELRSAMTWKEDVEAALEQLLGSITVPLQAGGIDEPVRRPVRTPAPAGRSGLLRATGEGRCAVIESRVE